jgi:uncharacterized protein
MKTIKILSIDGGGIRGIIPAIILTAIEEKTGKRIADLFDFIAGTSTGGILTLGLTKPNAQGQPEYSAKDLVKLYEKEGVNIFSNPEITPLWKRKYPSDGIEKVLSQYFGDTPLSKALKEVLVTSYDVEKRCPYFFKRSKARTVPELHDFPMAKVARATSAAPTYFEPLKLEVAKPSVPYHTLVDGGVFANNPAMCAYVEAKTLFPDATDFLVVSIGTGENARRLAYQNICYWGIAQWSQPLLDVAFDGVSDTVDYQLQQILPTTAPCHKNYYRFQTDHLEPNSSIDDASKDNLDSLKLLADKILEERISDIDMLCEQLLSQQVCVSVA